jgi:hypothetical protein
MRKVNELFAVADMAAIEWALEQTGGNRKQIAKIVDRLVQNRN